MKTLLLILISLPLFAQQEDGPRVQKTYTLASPPTVVAGTVLIFSDSATLGSCTPGGSALATCRWNGSAWQPTAGGGGGGGATDASIFSGGTQVLRSVQCAKGTVNSTSLTAAAANQEITIQTGISGNVRWDQIVVSETTQFAGTTGLTVSMGRPGSSNAEMTGANVPLMVSSGDGNFWSTRPIPPILTGTYSIVLNFVAASGNVNAASAGALTWEVCGYAAR